MKRAAALAACILIAACASAGAPQPVIAPEGYLTADEIASAADRIAHVEPTGERSDPRVRPGQDRWWLAIAHAELRPPESAQHFDCVLETRLSARPRPALTRLMARLLADAEALTRQAARRRGHVARPIALDRDLQPCQRVTGAIRDSTAWPAAAAVAGTLYGETFAALAPDRAAGVQRIGQEIGFSREICRMNSEDDVVAGAIGGRHLFELIARSPAFRADLEAARIEVTAARTERLGNPSCAAERRALGSRPASG
jgi:acid phosphatase (class A)